jgi:4'-phosphopantetheinyl transferase
VHVWRISLDRSHHALGELEALLSPGERRRARRFRFQIHRERFVVRRGALRCILGRYLGVAPADVALVEKDLEKPFVADAQRAGDVRFNLSHSGELALVAVARGREVGVDIEQARPEVAKERIPEQFFSRREVEVLRGLPQEHQVQGFFNCWTRKEAYVKAVGEGLSLPLDSFEVSLAPDEPAALLRTRPDPREAERWAMSALLTGPDYAAALVVEGQPTGLRCWDWIQ